MKNLPEFEGFWWVPEAPSEQLAGRLVSEDGDTRLVLTIDTPGRLPFTQSQSRDYALIHGRTASGKLITLIDCFDLNTNWSSQGVEKRIVLVNIVLEGRLIPPEMLNAPFHGIELNWPSLQNWFGISGLESEHEDGNPRAFTLNYTPPEKINFNYQEGVEIEFHFGTDTLPFPSPRGGSTNIREIVWVSLKTQEAQSLDYFLSKLNELVHFFTLCVLDYTEPEAVVLVGAFEGDQLEDGTKIPPRLTLHTNSVHKPRSKRLPHPLEMLVPYTSVTDSLSSLMPEWAKHADDLAPVRSLYFSTIYGRKGYIETSFLALAQAVEVLHRRKYGGTYVDASLFEENVRPSLEQAIPSDLPADAKQAFKQRLTYFNEISLAKRIKALCDRYSALWQQFLPDLKRHVRGVVDARNYFTHYSSLSPTARPDVDSLVDYEDFLKTLLELEMLASTGMSEGEIMQYGMRCRQYQRLFDRRRRG